MRKAGNSGRQIAPRIALFTLGLIVLGTAAQAQQPNQEQIDGMRKNCRSDFLSKCIGVKPGGADAFQCLKKNVAALSPGCQTAVNAVAGPAPASPPPVAAAPAATPQPKQTAPQPAPVTASPAPPPAATAKAAPTAPVKPAAPKPSVAKPKPAPKPKPAVATAQPAAASPAPPPPAAPKLSEREEKALVTETCRFDYLKFCPGILMGGGRILACLNGHAPQLSPACGAAMKVVNANR